jgi:hypothetical protein
MRARARKVRVKKERRHTQAFRAYGDSKDAQAFHEGVQRLVEPPLLLHHHAQVVEAAAGPRILPPQRVQAHSERLPKRPPCLPTPPTQPQTD